MRAKRSSRIRLDSGVFVCECESNPGLSSLSTIPDFITLIVLLITANLTQGAFRQFVHNRTQRSTASSNQLPFKTEHRDRSVPHPATCTSRLRTYACWKMASVRTTRFALQRIGGHTDELSWALPQGACLLQLIPY